LPTHFYTFLLDPRVCQERYPQAMKILGAALLAVAGLCSVARANVEIGGTAGLHVFNEDNKLGVVPGATQQGQKNSSLFGIRIGAYFTNAIGVEVEGGLIPTEPREMVFDVYDIVARAQLVYQVRSASNKAQLIPFVDAGGGIIRVVKTTNEDIQKKDTQTEIFLGIGAKYRAGGGWGVRVDMRGMLVPKFESGNTLDFEVTASLYHEFGGTKVVAVRVEEPKKEQADADGDGITGAADQCPNEAEDKDGFKDDDGCPDPDNDGDGIADANDKCAGEAEDKDGFQDDDGCPDPDNDNDGLADAADKCPTDAETRNGFADSDGCPDEIPAALQTVLAGPVAKVDFKANSADFAAGATAALDKIVPAFADVKDTKIEIGVHTDDSAPKGKFTDNDALSQARADAVKAYLVSKGVAEDVLVAKGYGSTTPVEDPKDLKGAKLNAARAKNRRVELKLVMEPAATPAGTPPAPEAPKTEEPKTP
jgi:outer membrane protein OmpA-like peptidoglycan-associated protein